MKEKGLWPERCEQRAFVEGAAWFQFKMTGFTPFPSERDDMESEAIKRYGDPNKNPAPSLIGGDEEARQGGSAGERAGR